MIERLWRSVKYEEIYLKSDSSGADCHAGLKAYFHYNTHIAPTRAWATRPPGRPSKRLSDTDSPTI